MFKTSELTGRIFQTLEKAEKTGKIEASIYDDLSILHNEFKELENFWLEKGSDMVNSFAMFHASKNCSNILKKMISRFENAHKEKQNPLIALDAMIILPPIFELKSILDGLSPSTLNKEISFNILDRIRNLRIHARRLNMLLPEEAEAKEISLVKSTKGFNVFVDKVKGILFEEQGSP